MKQLINALLIFFTIKFAGAQNNANTGYDAIGVRGTILKKSSGGANWVT